MARSKRNKRAQNKIEGTEGGLIKIDPPDVPEAPALVFRTQEVRVTRSTFFTADFEALIELIAIDRVRRMMRERWLRRPKLEAPDPPGDLPAIEE